MVLGAGTDTQASTRPLLYRNWLETDNKKVFSVGGTDTLAGHAHGGDDGYNTTVCWFSFRYFYFTL